MSVPTCKGTHRGQASCSCKTEQTKTIPMQKKTNKDFTSFCQAEPSTYIVDDYIIDISVRLKATCKMYRKTAACGPKQAQDVLTVAPSLWMQGSLTLSTPKPKCAVRSG